jgi:hypothetical protein
MSVLLSSSAAVELESEDFNHGNEDGMRRARYRAGCSFVRCTCFQPSFTGDFGIGKSAHGWRPFYFRHSNPASVLLFHNVRAIS